MIFLIFLHHSLHSIIKIIVQTLKSSFRRGLHAPHVHHSACHTLQLSMIYCPFRALIVLTITRRVAAGQLVLPFQGERMTVTHKRKTHPLFGERLPTIESPIY
ncbi:MAG: hypothetical protein LBG58_10555 [Planctomycetaceae bacterium]|nr:hypothetical protein [Planctomycetaceae bacterium]